MKIEVKSSEVNVKAGTSKKSGKPYNIREQIGYLFVKGEAYPQRFNLQLEDDQQPYAPGLYETDDELYVDDRNFNRLGASRRMTLTPIRKAA